MMNNIYHRLVAGIVGIVAEISCLIAFLGCVLEAQLKGDTAIAWFSAAMCGGLVVLIIMTTLWIVED